MGYIEEMELIMRNLEEYDKREKEEMKTLWVVVGVTVIGFVTLAVWLLWM